MSRRRRRRKHRPQRPTDPCARRHFHECSRKYARPRPTSLRSVPSGLKDVPAFPPLDHDDQEGPVRPRNVHTSTPPLRRAAALSLALACTPRPGERPASGQEPPAGAPELAPPSAPEGLACARVIAYTRGWRLQFGPGARRAFEERSDGRPSSAKRTPRDAAEFGPGLEDAPDGSTLARAGVGAVRRGAPGAEMPRKAAKDETNDRSPFRPRHP